MNYSQTGLSLTKHYETLHDGDLSKIGLQPKKDPAGIWTVAYGHALFFMGKPVKDISIVQKVFPHLLDMDIPGAEKLLQNEDIPHVENLVRTKLKVPVLQWQYDALIDHTYNCGYSETLYSLVNSKAPLDKINDWFLNHYITVDGKVLKGLQYRRKSEWILYSTGKLIFYN